MRATLFASLRISVVMVMQSGQYSSTRLNAHPLKLGIRHVMGLQVVNILSQTVLTLIFVVDECDETFRELFAPLTADTEVGQCHVGRGDFPGPSSSAVYKKVSSFIIASAALIAAFA